MENHEIDSALLLENELKRRVREIVQAEVEKAIVKYVGAVIRQEKEHLIMEVAMGVGKIIRLAEEEGRRPLWQSTPEEFGMTKGELNKHMLGKDIEINKETDNAIRKQT